ncbi:hypothetical protein PA598K_05804 [Paenibacillus sp. 598K]|uniref:nucleotidyltransferase family protein n=1 Tax=Paenibacillus sp. 598K TaxID=1117987 RepID=UPI000FFAE857|nr:nucleotidyltransferase family protein [Paenibacillus sp. 598K]GBF77268.1 hypothetical protein PA598K_05804 [Paenibacillus sp. 598K]
MKLKNEYDILRLIEADKWMMSILHNVNMLKLPDWWICAGFVRSKIWDALHGYTERTPLADVDVVYFDPEDTEEVTEKQLEQRLHRLDPTIPWSVKNEARMHKVNNNSPYASTVDAISKFPETATALGVTLDDRNNLILAAPCGIADVLTMTVRPTPFFAASPEDLVYYERRIAAKAWHRTWKQVTYAADAGRYM